MTISARIARHAAGAAFIVIACSPPASAQQTVASVVTFLMTNQGVATGNPQIDTAAAAATSETISRALLANVATLPVTSSSGAFVYRLNPELGTVERATETFGPFFIERASTVGRGQASIGLTFQQMRFTSLDGYNLRNGSFVTTANQFKDESAPYEVDQLTLNIAASVATLYGNVGITNRLEVGFALPMVSLSIDGSRVDTYRGRAFTQAKASATSIGLADVAIRTKYTLLEDHGSGLAAAVDLRLPTGRQENLLGAGSTSAKFSAIGSIESGPATLHVNGGISVGGLAREISYGGAIAVAAANRVTLIGELLARRLDDVGHILPTSAPTPGISGVQTIRLVPDGSALNLITAVPGVKWNVTDTWVLVANVSIPLSNAGLTAPFTPFVGLDYSVGR